MNTRMLVVLGLVGACAVPAVATAHDTQLTIGCYPSDSSPVIRGDVEYGRFPVPNGPKLYATLTVDGVPTTQHVQPITSSGTLSITTPTTYGDHNVQLMTWWTENGKKRTKDVSGPVSCPAPPVDPPVPPTPPTPETPPQLPPAPVPTATLVEPPITIIPPRPDIPIRCADIPKRAGARTYFDLRCKPPRRHLCAWLKHNGAGPRTYTRLGLYPGCKRPPTPRRAVPAVTG